MADPKRPEAPKTLPLDDRLRAKLWQDVDTYLAFAGEDVDGATCERECLAILRDPAWESKHPYPASNTAGGQSTYIDRLVREVLVRCGGKPAQLQRDVIPDQGEWVGRAADLKKRPL